MRKIVVDPAVAKELTGLSGQVVICDQQGRALGFFQPLSEPVPIEQLQLEPPWSKAEIEELRKNRDGKPLSEILKRLGYA